MNARAHALTTVSIPSLTMTEPELIKVLKTSIYPGAEDESIKLVIGYCRAARLDPLQKPVHIVLMDVKVSKNPDKYAKRDVIMPGIGLYRTQAARTGEYAGMSEPVFGEMVDFEFEEEIWEGSGDNRTKKKRDAKIQYPHSCSLTVRRNVNGVIVEFTATEFWLENYATAGNWTNAPNKMWKKRPIGQLAKCTEAQALRKAFPEIGAQPTAEEMEGKTIDITPAAPTAPALPPIMAGDPGSAPAGAASATTTTPATGDDKLLSDGERAHIKGKMESAALTEVDLKAKFGAGVEGLKASQFKDVKAWIAKPAG